MTRDITCIVCDDEFLGRKNIVNALSGASDWTVIAELEDGEELLELIQTHRPDVVFLDIHMPGASGIELMSQISQLASRPEIIFVTAFDQYAIQAFGLYALDYILKPFDERRFVLAVKRAEVELSRKSNGEDFAPLGSKKPYLKRIFVPSTAKLNVYEVEEIFGCVANGNYANVILKDRTVLHRVSMTYLEDHLDPADFMRVHRSSIVSVDQIKSVEHVGGARYELTLKNMFKVPLSKSKKPDVIKRLSGMGGELSE